MITASIVTYNHTILDIEPILRSLVVSPVQIVYIIDHSDERLSLKEEIDTLFLNSVEMREHIQRGFKLEYHQHINNGYGGGHNVAIRKALKEGSIYHLVVNPDVWFGHEVIPSLWKYMEEHPECGQIMPKVLFLDGSIQRLAKMLPTPLDIFCRFLLRDKYNTSRNRKFELQSTNYEKTLNVPFLSGCFMFFRMQALVDVDMFDEHFFMYAEDIDITRRVHRHYTTIFYPAVHIFHKFNRASHRELRLLRIHITNIIIYFNKWGWIFDKERDEFNAQLKKEIARS